MTWPLRSHIERRFVPWMLSTPSCVLKRGFAIFSSAHQDRRFQPVHVTCGHRSILSVTSVACTVRGSVDTHTRSRLLGVMS